jgi:hypothetical protein
MLVFGLVSAIFDFVTFAVLQIGFHARPELFRTAWFVESLLTELVIALVVRTGAAVLSQSSGESAADVDSAHRRSVRDPVPADC